MRKYIRPNSMLSILFKCVGILVIGAILISLLVGVISLVVPLTQPQMEMITYLLFIFWIGGVAYAIEF